MVYFVWKDEKIYKNYVWSIRHIKVWLLLIFYPRKYNINLGKVYVQIAFTVYYMVVVWNYMFINCYITAHAICYTQCIAVWNGNENNFLISCRILTCSKHIWKFYVQMYNKKRNKKRLQFILIWATVCYVLKGFFRFTVAYLFYCNT